MAQLVGPTVVTENVLEAAGAGGGDALDLRSVGSIAFPVAVVDRVEREGLFAARPWQLATKRAVDILGSLLLIVLLSPVFLGVALAVAFTSPGPVLYRQRRVGRDGRPFTMLKFRSMLDRAHEQRKEHVDQNECSGPVFKIRDDPRVTPVGRVIRHLSMDEIPQFFNVLRGQMSLVGPRPPLPEECTEYTEREMGRLRVKPGITCVWQVSGRSDIDFDTWVDLDLEYIRTWSLRQDILLLLKTLPAVLLARGAY